MFGPAFHLKRCLFVLALILGSIVPAFADVISDRVIANLKAQGFSVVRMNRTWLGRIWVLAESQDVRREIVFNPTTGEILRDYAVLLIATPIDRSGGAKSAPEPNQTGVQSVEAVIVANAADDPVDVVKTAPVASATGGFMSSDTISLDPVNPIAAQ